MHPIASALALLIRVAFDALLLLFLLRVFAERWRADFRNPVSQAIYRYSNPVLAPLRRLIPNWRRWNLAALVLAWVLEIFKLLALTAVAGVIPHIGGLLLAAFGALLGFALMMYVVLIFVWALASMFGGGGGGYGQSQHPAMTFITQITQPAMAPLAKRMPTLGGIDFSPTVAILVLLLAHMLIADPIMREGLLMAGLALPA